MFIKMEKHTWLSY